MTITNDTKLVYEIHRGLYGKVIYTSNVYTGKKFDKMVKDAATDCQELNKFYKRIKHYFSYREVEEE